MQLLQLRYNARHSTKHVEQSLEETTDMTKCVDEVSPCHGGFIAHVDPDISVEDVYHMFTHSCIWLGPTATARDTSGGAGSIMTSVAHPVT
jgi:hypothetical protein